MPRGKLLNGLVTQQKVLRAAVALFLEKGYTRTTTGEIAKAAGIGQSSFFHVFPSKEALLLELPLRLVCSENCKGICPSCGVNRNIAPCTCQEGGERQNPFSALSELLTEDEEV